VFNLLRKGLDLSLLFPQIAEERRAISSLSLHLSLSCSL